MKIDFKGEARTFEASVYNSDGWLYLNRETASARQSGYREVIVTIVELGAGSSNAKSFVLGNPIDLTSPQDMIRKVALSKLNDKEKEALGLKDFVDLH